MKSFKGTFVFAVIVAVIAGFALSEFKKADQEKAAEAVAKQLIKKLEVTDVQGLRYTSDTIQFSLESANGRWKLLTPVEDAADTDAVDSFVRGVAVTDVDEVPSESTVDWAKYGLDKPAGEIAIKLKDGKEYKFAIGSVRSFDQGYYLRMDGGANLLVAPKAFESYVGKNPKELRSKKIEFPTGDWTEMTLNSSNKEKPIQAKFSKGPSGWTSVKDAKQVLNQSSFGEFQRTISDIKGDDIVADASDKTKLAQFGLNKPETTMEIKIGDSSVKVLFSALKEENVYFTSSANKAIYRLPKRTFESVQKTNDDFRDRKFAFQFDSSKVTQIRLTDPTQKISKTFRKEATGWTTDIKFEPNQILKQAAVDELLTSLSGLDVRDFPGKKGGAGLTGEIALLDAADQPQLKFNFGKSYKVKDNEFYLVKTSQYDENFGVGKSTLDDFFKKEFFEVKPEPASAPAPAPANATAASGGNADKPPSTTEHK